MSLGSDARVYGARLKLGPESKDSWLAIEPVITDKPVRVGEIARLSGLSIARVLAGLSYGRWFNFVKTSYTRLPGRSEPTTLISRNATHV